MNTPVNDVDTQKIATAPKPAELIGTVVAHKYKLIESLGSGGMGVVFKAQHILMNKTVALKMLHPHLIVSDHCLIRFQQEAKAASHINHPNIISVFDFGTSESGQPFIVMDYIGGRSLEDLLKVEGALDPERCLRIFIQVADALAEAHKSGVIHRDLKPSNVMLVPDGTSSESVRIVDFGIAKILNSDANDQLTKTGEIFGSPCYMSPEQCRGSVLDERSDIYSLGCVLYEALTGKAPFHGETIFETMYFHLNKLPAPLSMPPGLGQRYRNRLEPIIFKSLEKSREQRIQSMAQLSSGLRSAFREDDWLANQSAAVHNWTAGIVRRSQDQIHVRLRTIAVGTLIAALAISSVVAISLLPGLKPPEVPDTPFHFGPKYIQEDPPPLPEDFEAREVAARGPLNSLQGYVSPTESRKLGLSWIQWGDFAMKYHLYSQAKKEYLRAYELAQRYPACWISSERSAIAKSLSECCYCMQDYAKAKEYDQVAIQLVVPILESSDQYFTKPYLQLADIYMREGNYEQARIYEEAVLKIMRINSTSTTSSEYLCCLCDLAETYYHLGHFRAAANCYEKSLSGWIRFDKLQNQNLGYCEYNLALCQSKLGQPRLAEPNFASALKLLKNAGSRPDVLSRASASYARFLWERNDWCQAALIRLKSIWL